jgi:hypothetical protein
MEEQKAQAPKKPAGCREIALQLFIVGLVLAVIGFGLLAGFCGFFK